MWADEVIFPTAPPKTPFEAVGIEAVNWDLGWLLLSKYSTVGVKTFFTRIYLDWFVNEPDVWT